MSTVETTGFAEVGAVTEPDYFARHQDAYQDIFLRLGGQADDTRTLEQAVAVSQGWIRGDYGHGDRLPVELRDSDKAALRGLCVNGLDMGPGIELPPGSYDKLLIFGASQFGNVRRSEAAAALLASKAHTFGRVVLLGGERPIYPKEVPGFRRLLQDQAVAAKAADDEWLSQLRFDFERHFPKGSDTSSIDPEMYKQFGETAQMRVSLIRVLGSVTLTSDSIETNKATGKPVGVQEFELTVNGSGEPVKATLLHCPPVDRKNGPPRHTTESCTGDVVDVVGVEADEQIAFIGAQPHLARMRMTVARAFAEAGRPEVDVWATGPGLDAETPVEICVSEVSKTLYEALRLRRQQASRS